MSKRNSIDSLPPSPTNFDNHSNINSNDVFVPPSTSSLNISSSSLKKKNIKYNSPYKDTHCKIKQDTCIENGEKDKNKKKRKKKCHICQKKLGLVPFICKCEQLFCSKHRYVNQHHCTYDYKNTYKDEFLKKNPKIVPEKIRKI
tara:strand:- start:23 stop:454 length:432 start_codon:yes stop_codon:yes gene_type:complete